MQAWQNELRVAPRATGHPDGVWRFFVAARYYKQVTPNGVFVRMCPCGFAAGHSWVERGGEAEAAEGAGRAGFYQNVAPMELGGGV